MILVPVALGLVLAQAPVPAYVEPPPSPAPAKAAAPVEPAPSTPPPAPAPSSTPHPGPLPASGEREIPSAPAAIPPPPAIEPELATSTSAPSSRYLVFQVAITAPVGQAAPRVPAAALYDAIVELELQLGTRTSASTLAGGYAGFGVGGVGTRARRLCNAAEQDDCSTLMARGGAFLRAGPDRPAGLEPWALVGLGARVDAADVPDAHGTEHARVAWGGEVRVSGGIDFAPPRTAALGEGLAFGLYLDAAVFQALGGDAIPELGVAAGRRDAVGWIGGGVRLRQR